MWDSTDRTFEQMNDEQPATTDLFGNNVYFGDDVFYGNEGVFRSEDLTFSQKELLNELGWEKGEYQHA